MREGVPQMGDMLQQGRSGRCFEYRLQGAKGLAGRPLRMPSDTGEGDGTLLGNAMGTESPDPSSRTAGHHLMTCHTRDSSLVRVWLEAAGID